MSRSCRQLRVQSFHERRETSLRGKVDASRQYWKIHHADRSLAGDLHVLSKTHSNGSTELCCAWTGQKWQHRYTSEQAGSYKDSLGCSLRPSLAFLSSLKLTAFQLI